MWPCSAGPIPRPARRRPGPFEKGLRRSRWGLTDRSRLFQFTEVFIINILPRDKNQRPHSTQLRNEPTAQERRLWYGFLRTASPQWNRQRIIGSYIVDFFCRKAQLIVELDGGQHYDESGLVEYDRIRTDYLEALGLSVLRFTNLEVDKNFTAVCRKIQWETEQRIKSSNAAKGKD